MYEHGPFYSLMDENVFAFRKVSVFFTETFYLPLYPIDCFPCVVWLVNELRKFCENLDRVREREDMHINCYVNTTMGKEVNDCP